MSTQPPTTTALDVLEAPWWGNVRLNEFLSLVYVVVAITAFPSTTVYYLAPVVVVLWSIVAGGIVSSGKLARLVVALLALTAVSLAWNEIAGLRNNYAGVVFAGITWLPILILLANRGAEWRMDDRVTHHLVVFLSVFVLLQSAAVAFQMTQTSDWDALAGTYGFLDYRGQITISQVLFTFNIFVINLFLIPYWRYRIVKVALFAGFAAVAAAQSGHQTIFFVVTIIAVFASLKRMRTWFRVIVAAGFLVAVVLWFFPQTPRLAVLWMQKVFFQEFPKSLIVLEAYRLLQDPKVALMGTGIGQFTSRAALFSSGEYLNVALPTLLTGQSIWYTEIVTPLLDLQEQIGEGSAIAKPYFSLVTIVIELGLVVTALLGLWILKQGVRARRLFQVGIKEVVGLARFQVGFLLFLVLCSTIENYFEFVQALMLPVVLYVFATGRIAYCLERDNEELAEL
jgi:hypothetical protein